MDLKDKITNIGSLCSDDSVVMVAVFLLEHPPNLWTLTGLWMPGSFSVIDTDQIYLLTKALVDDKQLCFWSSSSLLEASALASASTKHQQNSQE